MLLALVMAVVTNLVYRSVQESNVKKQSNECTFNKAMPQNLLKFSNLIWSEIQ